MNSSLFHLLILQILFLVNISGGSKPPVDTTNVILDCSDTPTVWTAPSDPIDSPTVFVLSLYNPPLYRDPRVKYPEPTKYIRSNATVRFSYESPYQSVLVLRSIRNVTWTVDISMEDEELFSLKRIILFGYRAARANIVGGTRAMRESIQVESYGFFDGAPYQDYIQVTFDLSQFQESLRTLSGLEMTYYYHCYTSSKFQVRNLNQPSPTPSNIDLVDLQPLTALTSSQDSIRIQCSELSDPSTADRLCIQPLVQSQCPCFCGLRDTLDIRNVPEDCGIAPAAYLSDEVVNQPSSIPIVYVVGIYQSEEESKSGEIGVNSVDFSYIHGNRAQVLVLGSYKSTSWTVSVSSPYLKKIIAVGNRNQSVELYSPDPSIEIIFSSYGQSGENGYIGYEYPALGIYSSSKKTANDRLQSLIEKYVDPAAKVGSFSGCYSASPGFIFKSKSDRAKDDPLFSIYDDIPTDICFSERFTTFALDDSEILI